MNVHLKVLPYLWNPCKEKDCMLGCLKKKKKKWNRNVLSHNISELNNREDAENSIKGGIGLTIEQDTKAATHI